MLQAGHKWRDGAHSSLLADPIDTGETYDCVIVGGGISGIAAALFFQRLAGPGKSCLILENHPIFGGEAKQNEFEVDGKRLIARQGLSRRLSTCIPVVTGRVRKLLRAEGMRALR